MSEKLQKILANFGYGSRRQLEKLIESGRVNVDGKVATLGDRVTITPSTKIKIDNQFIELMPSNRQICRVLVYYKPEGELCTRSDPEGRPTVFDRLPQIKNGRWVAVGRLDINTSGILLFTNDGELANKLMHPSKEVEREYAVRVFGQIETKQLKRLTDGVQLEDGLAAFKKITRQGGEGMNQWFNVILTEGRNREVRRLWEAVDVQVNRLIRIRYGDITLPRGLPRGGWMELNLTTVNYLRKLVDLKAETLTKLSLEREKKKIRTNRIKRSIVKHSERSRSTANHVNSKRKKVK